MSASYNLDNPFFPDEASIPAKFKNEQSASITHTLINGKLEKWEGAYADVLSPICVEKGQPSHPQPLCMGRTPLMDHEASLKALSAAKQAYAQGSGVWPTLSVSERIETKWLNFSCGRLEKRKRIPARSLTEPVITSAIPLMSSRPWTAAPPGSSWLVAS